MVAYGMAPVDVLRAATSVNARTFHLENLGKVREGFLADLIAVQGNPLEDIKNLREVSLVMLNGTLLKTP